MRSTEAELQVDRLSKLGEGVASHGGRTVFVEGALPGERVLARIREERGVLRGELLEVRSRSAARRAPICPVADRCGGCDWLHLEEGAQREAKVEILLSALEHLGGVGRGEVELLPAVASPASLHYRRRAVLHPSRRALAFYGRRSHETVEIDSCPALLPALEPLPGRLAQAISPILADADHVSLLSASGRVAFSAALKSGARVKDSHRKAADGAVRAGLVAGAVVVPEEGPAHLSGDPVLREMAPLRPELPLFLRPDAFAQANGEANALLVEAALRLLAPKPAEGVLELYAGNGNFTFALAARAASVLAVESSPVSLELARRSAREGRVDNVRFVQGDAAKVVEGLVKEGRRFDALLLDPPRTGAKECVGWAAKLGVGRIAYVACDPAALARDARALCDGGFSPAALQAVDMFPQTRHIEAVMSFAARG